MRLTMEPQRTGLRSLGEWFEVAVAIHNGADADLSWSDETPVRLSYHWIDPASGTSIHHDGVRTAVGANMPAGEKRWVLMRVQAPSVTGLAVLRACLVHDGHFWFDEIAPESACDFLMRIVPSSTSQLTRHSGALDVLAGHDRLSLSGCLLSLTIDGALGRAGESLLMPLDSVMFPAIIASSGWQLEELEFLSTRLNPARTYEILDIGANVGLFSRQAGLRFPNIAAFYCVEPDARNYRALRYNMMALPRDACRFWNVALAHDDSEKEFFRDNDNMGNYSLNPDAMRGRPFHTTRVRTLAAGRWMRECVKPKADVDLIWKSDTQGYDELIVSLAPMEIWSRLAVAIVELWRIRKPDFDIAAFRQRIDDFPNRSIGGTNVSSTDEVLDYLSGDDWRHEDLYLWR